MEKRNTQGNSDEEWSRRMASIAIATISVAQPKIVELSDEQWLRCTEIVAEEIYVRLRIGDRPLGDNP
ncbi:hypothetical protein GCM10007301_02080 [Azorhizobium oxalatiphilum]|uniref:Uncharacterized protein n=1 Tax=Azorhizobium oxalatiphilum TaxID=980631 RepID=A0A917F3W3_9HYPH|nr:hypothetical protein GCM10007301_02080 [Azorhizobium oxalatiphilum]